MWTVKWSSQIRPHTNFNLIRDTTAVNCTLASAEKLTGLLLLVSIQFRDCLLYFLVRLSEVHHKRFLGKTWPGNVMPPITVGMFKFLRFWSSAIRNDWLLSDFVRSFIKPIASMYVCRPWCSCALYRKVNRVLRLLLEIKTVVQRSSIMDFKTAHTTLHKSSVVERNPINTLTSSRKGGFDSRRTSERFPF